MRFVTKKRATMLCEAAGCYKPSATPHMRKGGGVQQYKYCTSCNNNWKKYGLVTPQRDELLAAQGGQCKACGGEIKFAGYSTSNKMDTIHACVDHCHRTGKIRGILCGACNITLGKAQEDPRRLRALADYVEAKIK